MRPSALNSPQSKNKSSFINFHGEMYGANEAAYYSNYQAAQATADSVSPNKAVYKIFKAIHRNEPATTPFEFDPVALDASKKRFFSEFGQTTTNLMTRYIKHFSPKTRYSDDPYRPDVLAMLHSAGFSPNVTIPHENGLNYTAIDYAMDISDQAIRIELEKMGATSVLSAEQKTSANRKLKFCKLDKQVRHEEEEIQALQSKLVQAKKQLSETSAKRAKYVH